MSFENKDSVMQEKDKQELKKPKTRVMCIYTWQFRQCVFSPPRLDIQIKPMTDYAFSFLDVLNLHIRISSFQ